MSETKQTLSWDCYVGHRAELIKQLGLQPSATVRVLPLQGRQPHVQGYTLQWGFSAKYVAEITDVHGKLGYERAFLGNNCNSVDTIFLSGSSEKPDSAWARIYELGSVDGTKTLFLVFGGLAYEITSEAVKNLYTSKSNQIARELPPVNSREELVAEQTWLRDAMAELAQTNCTPHTPRGYDVIPKLSAQLGERWDYLRDQQETRFPAPPRVRRNIFGVPQPTPE